ncbi:MAG: bacterial Ig-like domain-containing protein [Clostridia bacterium]|nr:bacterial Ig-like domain-containing protein [Clostridia bacterium]
MKKLLALLLAALFVLGTASMIVLAEAPHPIERDEKNIIKMNWLDFNPEANALWAEQGADGKWSATIGYNDFSAPENEDGDIIGAYLRADYSTCATNTEWSFVDGGEVLRLQVTGDTTTPGFYFILDEYHYNIIPVGSESSDNPKAEYMKIRVKNYSTANRFTFAWTSASTNQYRFMGKTISDLKIDNNGKEYQSVSGEWQTYIVNMNTLNLNTNYEELLPTDIDGNLVSTWGGNLEAILLFPFGYDVTDGTGAYPGAMIDIDYVVLGSLDYVTNYKSDLEIKEESITKLELVSEPTKKNYYVGESLDLEGLQLKATYKDGTTEMLSTNPSYTANLEEGGTNTPVKLTFGTQSVNYNINVTGVSSIEVAEKPADTTYEVAEVADGFTADGFTFKVNYADGTSTTFPSSSVRCYSNDTLTTAGTKAMIANFYGIETNFDIDVVNVTDIEVTPNASSIRYKDTLTSDNTSVTFVYNDGTKIASGDSAIELEYTFELDTKTAGEAILKTTATNATYGINIVKETPVTIETPTGMTVSTKPLKVDGYQPGDQFDKTGLAVSLVYEDGKKIVLDESDYTVRANLTNPGSANVSIKCSIEGLEDLKLDERLTVTVEGEVEPSDNTTPANTTRPGRDNDKKDDGNGMIIVIVIVVIVVVAAAAAVVLVVLKKKKK